MTPDFEEFEGNNDHSFGLSHRIESNFDNNWHYHTELELHYIVRGDGIRFIGDSACNFSAGDIFFLGENLPHTFRSSDEYFNQSSGCEVESIVLQFRPDCLGQEIFHLPEACNILSLFEKAKKGMVIRGATRVKLATLMAQSCKASNMEKLIFLLSILNLLAETTEYQFITDSYTFFRPNDSNTIKLKRIYTHTLSNYKKEISLEEIADICHLSVTSFCRYFKLMTKKTYYDLLIEIRISHSRRMLLADRHPAEKICFDCGFNNVSNFYRHFKKITGMTPLAYRKKALDFQSPEQCKFQTPQFSQTF